MKVYSNENIEKKRKRIHALTITLKAIVTIILLPILIVNCILLAKSIIYPDKTPDILGYKTFVVVSGSMEPEINVGDLIIVNKNKSIRVGDIITYKADEIITHRVVQIKINGEAVKLAEVNAGTSNVQFVTKGDKNSMEETLADKNNIEGVYVLKLPGMGQFIMFLQSPFVTVAIVLILLAMYINTRTIENRKTMRKQKRISYENKK